MISKNKTAAEKAWHTTVADFARRSHWLNTMYGGIVSDPYQFQLDHILGAQAKRKINGVTTKVGEWAVMPIPVEIHDITSNHALNRTLKPKAYRDAFGRETDVFASFIGTMQAAGISLPFDDDIFNAIVGG